MFTARNTGTGGVAGARPMTGVRAAGFSRSGRPGTGRRDVSGHRVGIPKEQKKKTTSDIVQELEATVNRLMEASAEASVAGNHRVALDRARDAIKKVQMTIMMEKQGMNIQITNDIAYSINFHLGCVQNAAGLYKESLNTFSALVQGREGQAAAQVRVMMGNIYIKMDQFDNAIKMFRMAYDRLPPQQIAMRLRIVSNIAVCFLKQEKWGSAIEVLEETLSLSQLAREDEEDEENQTEIPPTVDFQTLYNLIICYYAIDDDEAMFETFCRVLELDSPNQYKTIFTVSDDHITAADDQQLDALEKMATAALMDHSTEYEEGDTSNFLEKDLSKVTKVAHDGTPLDELHEYVMEQRWSRREYLRNAAKLIAPVLDSDPAVGFDLLIEKMKETKHLRLAAELEIAKSVAYLYQGHFEQAVEVLRNFERTSSDQVRSGLGVYTNLSFIHFIRGEYTEAEEYADQAIEADRYNAFARVAKGNCCFMKKDLVQAAGHYIEAQNINSACVEATYNLGLVRRQMNLPAEALECFLRVNEIVGDSADTLYNIAECYASLPEPDEDQAQKYYSLCLTKTPQDVGVLTRLGQLYATQNNETQALHFFHEAFKFCPTSIDILSWIAAYYVKAELYDKAAYFFRRADRVDPKDPRWLLMVGSCMRRLGNHEQALQQYLTVHQRFPDSVECLRYLVHLCSEMGRTPDAQKYAALLQKALEKAERDTASRHTEEQPHRSSGNVRKPIGAAPNTRPNSAENEIDRDGARVASAINSFQAQSGSAASQVVSGVRMAETQQQQQQQGDDLWGDDDMIDLPL